MTQLYIMNAIYRLVACLLLITSSSNLLTAQNSLKDKVIALDSLFFTAYNYCDTLLQEKMYADKIEFYHDLNGLDTSKQSILSSTVRYICGKVERKLIPESIEVYPIKDYGAVQIGLHQFINKAEGNTVSPPYKFIIFWKNDNDEWTIEKIVSLHL